MVFLLLSVDYPTVSTRRDYQKEGGPHSYQVASFHKPLAASADDDQWKRIRSAVSSVESDEGLIKRPLKPNDDNYRAFQGSEWDPEGDFSLPPAMKGMLQLDDTVPHYSRCANCTHPAKTRCSRCKFVQYCSKACQTAHWKAVHRSSCESAKEVTLQQALQTNDGFYISPPECEAMASELEEYTDSVCQCFRAYFAFTARLGGCFVL